MWKAALELAVRVYALTAKDEFRGRASLRDQIERAAVSVSNNGAEGFERGTTQELLTFIYIARGSAGEVRSMSYLLERLAIFENLKFEIFKFEIFEREHITAASWMGGFVAKFRDQRAAIPKR